MSKTRVLYIHHGNARAGAFISLMSLLDHLDRERFEPSVCSAECDPEVVRLAASAGWDACNCRLRMFAHTTLGSYHLWRPEECVEFLAWFRDYRTAKRRLSAMLASLKPDIVHLNSLPLAPYAGVSHGMGIPTVVHVRDAIAPGSLGLRKAWLGRLLRGNADGVVCICRDNAARLGLERDKCTVVYNPIDHTRFDRGIDALQARQQLGIPVDAKTVLFAGGADAITKGLYDFLEAMVTLVGRQPRVLCLMPGFSAKRALAPDWTTRRRIAWALGRYRRRDHCRRLVDSRLEGRVVGCDFTREMEYWIAASDVVCVPHIQPHFSRTVIEAGAMGRPVVAYRVGGVEEVAVHEQTALLVDSGDVRGLMEAVERLLWDPALCQRLGERGFEQARELCDGRRSAQQVEAVYERVRLARQTGRTVRVD